MPRTEFYRKAQLCYAQSWALMCFFNEHKYTHGRLLDDILDRLLDLERPQRAIRDALAEVDVEELESAFKEYLNELLRQR